MSKENFTLFVGDLSLFCNASHLKQAFSKFGEITAVRIAFDEQSQKQLHFGFVEFATYDSALTALNAMNGTVLCGRILRVKWAINRNDNSGEDVKKAPNYKLETSSVHVNFLSYQTSKLVSEELLRSIFSAYGEVKDVIIKKSTKDHNIQRGYGFVHYSNTAEGIQSTLTAIASMYDVTIDNVNFTCAMSHACEQGFLSAGAAIPQPVFAAPDPFPHNNEGYLVPVHQSGIAGISAVPAGPPSAAATTVAPYYSEAPPLMNGQYFMYPVSVSAASGGSSASTGGMYISADQGGYIAGYTAAGPVTQSPAGMMMMSSAPATATFYGGGASSAAAAGYTPASMTNQSQGYSYVYAGQQSQPVVSASYPPQQQQPQYYYSHHHQQHQQMSPLPSQMMHSQHQAIQGNSSGYYVEQSNVPVRHVHQQQQQQQFYAPYYEQPQKQQRRFPQNYASNQHQQHRRQGGGGASGGSHGHHSGGSSPTVASAATAVGDRLRLGSFGRSHSEPISAVVTAPESPLTAARQYHSALELSHPQAGVSVIASAGANSPSMPQARVVGRMSPAGSPAVTQRASPAPRQQQQQVVSVVPVQSFPVSP